MERARAETQTIRSPSVGVERERAAQRVGFVAWTMLACAFLLPCTPVAGGPLFWHIWRAVLALTVALFVARRAARWGHRPMPGTFSITPEGLVMESPEGVVRTPWAQVRGALLIPEGDAARLRIECAEGEVLHVQVASSEEGHALLAAMGLDASRRVVNVSLGPPWHRVAFFVASAVGGTCLLMLLSLARGAWLWERIPVGAWWFIALFFGALGALAYGPGRVTLGADGLTIQKGWRQRFIPYEDVQTFHQRPPLKADRHTWPGTLVLRSGEQIHLATSDGRIEPISAVGALIEARKRDDRAASHEAAVLALLERGGDSFDTWRARVRALASLPSAFRGASVTPEDLVRVAEDPAASPEHRLAAVVALASSGDADARTRVRVAIDACANEPLRDALDAATHDALDAEAAARVARNAPR